MLALSKEPTAATTRLLFSIGTCIFSGSLYLLAITGAKWLGAITPLGGACFLDRLATVGVAAKSELDAVRPLVEL